MTDIEPQLSKVLSWKRNEESILREFHSLERKVQEVARVCEERNVEASRRMEQALREHAKHDGEDLAQHLAQLKETAIQGRNSFRHTHFGGDLWNSFRGINTKASISVIVTLLRPDPV